MNGPAWPQTHHGGLDRARELSRIRAADDDIQRGVLPCHVGHEQLRQSAAAQIVELHVLDDADHLDPRRRRGCARQEESLADGGPSRPRSVRELPIDDDDTPVVVVCREVTTRQNRHAQRFEALLELSSCTARRS